MDTTTAEYVYVGRRQSSSRSRLFHAYQTGRGEELALYAKPIGRVPLPVGSTVIVEELPESRVRYVSHRLPEAAGSAAEWSVMDRAASIAVERVRLTERMRKESLDLSRMTLGELATYTARLLPDQRTAVVALVLGYLR